MDSLQSTFWSWTSTIWADWQGLFRIVFIVLGAVIARALLQLSVRRVVNRVATGAKTRRLGADSVLADVSPLSHERLEQRARTMGSVLGNLITWTIVILAVTMALSELGVDVGVFAAGLGLLGAGVGFGAQSLVRDLISGLFIVFEDQYGVGDMVDLGQASGVVESVGLRVTQVRDAEGILWYVRNGEVIRVGNHSQGWSRVVLDVAVPFDVDIDKVESAMLSAAKTVAKDPTLSAGLIGEPEVWGIQMLSGDEVVIRLVQKLKPAVQDSTARALRLEVKKAFDGAKIAMASSQTPVHVSLLNPASKK